MFFIGIFNHILNRPVRDGPDMKYEQKIPLSAQSMLVYNVLLACSTKLENILDLLTRVGHKQAIGLKHHTLGF